MTHTLLCACVITISCPYRRVGAFAPLHRFRRPARLHTVVKILPPPVKTIRNPSLNLMEWRVLLNDRRGGSYSLLNVYVIFSLSSGPESISVPRFYVDAFQSLGLCLISVIEVLNSVNCILSFKLIYMQFACQSFFEFFGFLLEPLICLVQQVVFFSILSFMSNSLYIAL